MTQQQDNTDGLTPFPYLHNASSDKDEPGMYLVYAKADSCKRVRAISATEAIRVSGIEKPLKVVRFNPLNQVLLPLARYPITGAATGNSVMQEAPEVAE